MSVKLRPLVEKLNQTTRMALEDAAGLCLSRSHYNVEIEHFLLKLLDIPAGDLRLILTHFGVDAGRAASEMSRSLDKLKTGNSRTPSFSPYLMEALVQGWVYASLEYSAQQIRSGFVLIGLLAEAELSRLTRDVSPSIGQIEVSTLRRDFMAIASSSVETETAGSTAVPAAPGLSGAPRVFISYFPEEGEFHADVLSDRMLASAPNVRVLRDTDTVQPGMVFTEKIDETIRASDIVLALIGEKWLTAADRPDNWVRLEIAAALRYEKTVVPCLIGGARMPAANELPPELAGLEKRHAVSLSQTPSRRETEELIRMIKSWRPR